MNKINNLLIIVFIIVFNVSLNAQDYKKNIEVDFNDYLNYIVNKDFEKSLNYISEDFYKIIPKQQLLLIMEQTFNNPDVVIEIKNPKILEIKEYEKIENKYYSFLTYSNQMNIKMKSDENESEEEKKESIELMKSMYEITFGKGNVYFDEKTNFFEIKVVKNVYAISLDGLSNWKFVVIEKKQKPLLEKVLPKTLINRI